MKLTFMISLLAFLAASCGNPHISSEKDGLEVSNPPSTPDESETTAGSTGGATTGGTTTGGTTTGGTTTGGTTTGGTTTGGTTTGGTTTGGTTTGGTTTSGTAGGTTGGAPCIPGGASESELTFFFGSRAEGQQDMTPERYSAFLNCKTVVTETFGSSRNGFSSLITNESRSDYSYELIHQVEKNDYTGAVLLEDYFGTQTYSMELERPVSQNGAFGKDRGVDSHSANKLTKDALVWSFSSPVSFFGAKVLDVESSPTEPARLRLFDCNRTLIKEVIVQYPNNEQGQKENHFIGFIGPNNNVCHVSLTVGDYQRPAPSASRAFFRALAVDEFNYGK